MSPRIWSKKIKTEKKRNEPRLNSDLIDKPTADTCQNRDKKKNRVTGSKVKKINRERKCIFSVIFIIFSIDVD